MTYEEAFLARLGAADLSRLHLLPEDQGRAALREILETGCLSQNEANILLARRAIAEIDPDWLAAQLPEAAALCLFQEPAWQAWEVLRLGEMLRGPYAAAQRPAAFARLIELAKGLHSPEVDEVLADVSGWAEYE